MMIERARLMRAFLCVIVAIGLFVGAFLLGRVSKAFERGLFVPEYLSDRPVIARIEEFGVKVPPSARNLSLLASGLEEPFLWIGMEIAPEDRGPLMAEWFRNVKSAPRPLQREDFQNYRPPSFVKHDEDPRLDPTDWSGESAFRATDNPSQFERVFLSDEATGRVLLYYWHE